MLEMFFFLLEMFFFLLKIDKNMLDKMFSLFELKIEMGFFK